MVTAPLQEISMKTSVNYEKLTFHVILRDIVIVVLLICTALLAKAVIEQKRVIAEDERYFSAESTRTFIYANEGDRIYIPDSEYGEIWYAAETDVPLHGLDFSNVREKDGLKGYYEGDTCITKNGIDVSYFQGDIDWERVKAAGIDFAILRVGYRGYETGNITLDSRFHEYAAGAAAAGIETGAYFFSQAVSIEEAAEEAKFVLDEIQGYSMTYPVVFDWEPIGGDTSRTTDVPVRTLNSCARVFCNALARGGYIPMVYTNRRMGLVRFDPSEIAGFDMWIADYREETYYPYSFAIWQYASDGQVDGIDTPVDLNMSFIDYTKVRR